MAARQLTPLVFQPEGAPGTSQACYPGDNHRAGDDESDEQVDDDCVIPRAGAGEAVRERDEDGEDEEDTSDGE
jgi:hypothetical protein